MSEIQPIGNDPTRIDVEAIFQLRDWADKLGVTVEEIRAAVLEVGDSADQVADYLKREGR